MQTIAAPDLQHQIFALFFSAHESEICPRWDYVVHKNKKSATRSYNNLMVQCSAINANDENGFKILGSAITVIRPPDKETFTRYSGCFDEQSINNAITNFGTSISSNTENIDFLVEVENFESRSLPMKDQAVLIQGSEWVLAKKSEKCVTPISMGDAHGMLKEL